MNVRAKETMSERESKMCNFCAHSDQWIVMLNRFAMDLVMMRMRCQSSYIFTHYKSDFEFDSFQLRCDAIRFILLIWNQVTMKCKDNLSFLRCDTCGRW